MEPWQAEIAAAVGAARAGGALIMDHYDGPERRGVLKKDQTPVTAADVASHWAIRAHLREVFPNDSVVSEEDLRTAASTSERTWVVDPLDGTRDFLARTGEFCVHVALLVHGVPTVGVVLQPVSGALCWASLGNGAYQEHGGIKARLQVSHADDVATARIGISRTNQPPNLRRLLDTRNWWSNARPMGASTKLMALARGDLDAVINLSSAEMPWDTCAPWVILREAGGAYTGADGHPLVFNNPTMPARRGTLASNTRLHAALVEAVEEYLP